MNIRNTNQKKIILDTLSSLRTHPTINELYDKVKEKNSNIGIATVYRNIKKYVDDGIIFVVKTNDGIDRYDYYGDHIHFECLGCGKIIDIDDDELQKGIREKTKENDLKFESCNILINGYCKQCKKND